MGSVAGSALDLDAMEAFVAAPPLPPLVYSHAPCCKLAVPCAGCCTPPPPPPFVPPDPALRPIFHVPADNAPGYVGDANGMMWRRVPWDRGDDKQGLFHLFWQAEFVHGLWWCEHCDACLLLLLLLTPCASISIQGARRLGRLHLLAQPAVQQQRRPGRRERRRHAAA